MMMWSRRHLLCRSGRGQLQARVRCSKSPPTISKPSMAALIGPAGGQRSPSHRDQQPTLIAQAPRPQLLSCGAPGSWRGVQGRLALWRLINPKSHSRMYHHSAIRAHAWPPRLQSPEGKCNSRPSLRHSTATHASICGDVDGATLCARAKQVVGFGFTCI